MFGFSYQDGQLYVDAVPVAELADTYGTPCYIYSRHVIEANWSAFDNAFPANKKHLVCYAVKANSNLAVLGTLARLNSGFDIVSAGELYRVIRAGGTPDKVVFSGVGKCTHEMTYALEQNIKCFNVESLNELTRLNAVAASMGCVAPIALRVNPDIDSKAHPYISTGLKENKFGIAFDDADAIYQQAAQMDNIRIIGISCHIGSQVMSLKPFQNALRRVLILVEKLKKANIELEHIDIGGGLGISYQDESPPTPAEYINAITETLGDDPTSELIIEPGRSIVGNAGILLTRVEYLNTTPYKNFAVVDAAMNDLLRPALYDGWHDIKPIIEQTSAEEKVYDVVGPVCETGDFLGKARPLRLEQGDLLAICSAGAYSFAMASNYNSRPRPPELIVSGKQAFEARKRESFADLINGEACL